MIINYNKPIEEYNGKYTIYAHINKINGKIYIGQTGTKPELRWGKNGSRYVFSTHFYNAIKKYGWDNFDHIILIENLSLELANILEEALIKEYKTMDRRYGYNMIAGGNNHKRRRETVEKIAAKNRNPSEETRRKISLALMGRPVSDETREKLRNSNLGKKRSEETKKRISEGHKNPSEETRRKISEAGKGRKPSEKAIEASRRKTIGNKYRAKPIMQYDLDGKFIKQWECAKDVENELGIYHSAIGLCCNGKSNMAGGFQWKYDDGNFDNIEPYAKRSNKVKVNQYDMNWNYIKTWESFAEIQKELGYNRSNILKVIKGEIKSAYGYKWKRCDEVNHNDKKTES